MTERFNLFVGYDGREPLTYRACLNSVRAHPPLPALIHPLVQHVLRAEGLYTRDVDARASTEFSLTRFLVPFVCPEDRRRCALFCDCDFIFTGTLQALVSSTLMAQPGKALWVVKHATGETLDAVAKAFKMDGQRQYFYPRKWWSALMLWNLDHPAHQRLTLRDVNSRPPSYLHRFEWLYDGEIGDIDPTWHWLDGYSEPPKAGTLPAGIHLTRGTPEHGPQWSDTRYANLWRQYAGWT